MGIRYTSVYRVAVHTYLKTSDTATTAQKAPEFLPTGNVSGNRRNQHRGFQNSSPRCLDPFGMGIPSVSMAIPLNSLLKGDCSLSLVRQTFQSVVQCTNSPSHIFWLTGQLQWLIVLPFRFDLCNFQVLTCQAFFSACILQDNSQDKERFRSWAVTQHKKNSSAFEAVSSP